VIHEVEGTRPPDRADLIGMGDPTTTAKSGGYLSLTNPTAISAAVIDRDRSSQSIVLLVE